MYLLILVLNFGVPVSEIGDRNPSLLDQALDFSCSFGDKQPHTQAGSKQPTLVNSIDLFMASMFVVSTVAKLLGSLLSVANS